MKDFYDYYAIDWRRTGDSIRSLLFAKLNELGFADSNVKVTYVELAAKALHKDERTIYSWLDGSKHLSVDDLLLLTKLLNCSFEDILEIRGETDKSVEELYRKYSRSEMEHNDTNKEIECAFAMNVLLNELINQEAPINTLSDLILYLPLFVKEIFHDSLFGIYGDVYGKRKEYIQEKLKHCYDTIVNTEAKQYADTLRKFMSEKPVVQNVTEKTKDQASIEKCDSWSGLMGREIEAILQTDDCGQECDSLKQRQAYMKALSEYTQKSEYYFGS